MNRVGHSGGAVVRLLTRSDGTSRIGRNDMNFDISTAACTTAPTTNEIVAAIRSRAFRFANETELQTGIGRALSEHHIQFAREVALTAQDRVDFLVGDVGIEVKVAASPNAVIRQLHRYVQSERVATILLVTASMRLATSMPLVMNSKPIVTCFVGDAL